LRALIAYLRLLGYYRVEAPILGLYERAAKRHELRRIVRKHRDRLRSDTEAWGVAGFALTAPWSYRAAVHWMADWAERPGVEPWMLANLILALRALGDVEQANRVSRHALGLRSSDPHAFRHALWLAADEAIAGDLDAATAHLGSPDLDALDPTHRYLVALVQSLIDIGRAPASGRRAALVRTHRTLRVAASSCKGLHEDRPAIVNTYRRAVDRIAALGGLSAWLWALRHRVVPLVPRP
jgi:hypothetical protein